MLDAGTRVCRRRTCSRRTRTRRIQGRQRTLQCERTHSTASTSRACTCVLSSVPSATAARGRATHTAHKPTPPCRVPSPPQEYVVRNFEEAVELLNWGLENRVMGCTKMNATSSRSHTVLTVSVRRRAPVLACHACAAHERLGVARAQVKQHGKDDSAGVITTRRGKLIFVDLAGSERVRRTTSTCVAAACPHHPGPRRARGSRAAHACPTTPRAHAPQRGAAVGGQVHQHVAVGAGQRHRRAVGSAGAARAVPRLETDAPVAGQPRRQGQHSALHNDSRVGGAYH